MFDLKKTKIKLKSLRIPRAVVDVVVLGLAVVVDVVELLVVSIK